MRRITTAALGGILSLLIGLLLLIGAPSESARATQLEVGLYPYVPRLDQFRTAITAEWQKVQPTVTLHFLSTNEWDGGYSKDPPANADVFVFDAVYFEYFRGKGWLEPLTQSEINNLSDFVAYALDGVKVGSLYYSIPQLGCANILFYQKTDTALANAKTLSAVNAALGRCTYTSQVPPDRRGLMIDMAGKATVATLYLDTTHSLNGLYPLPLPSKPSDVNAAAIANMRVMMADASWENATIDTSDEYQRSAWFGQGWGRAVVGYSESMSAMSDAVLANIAFKVMPLSDNAATRPLFYSDVIGVNSTTNQRGTRALAVQLANVMASAATMVSSLEKTSSTRTPQYLMPARTSVFDTLGKTYPIYKEMSALVSSSNPIMFKLNDQSRGWFNSMADVIRTDSRQNYACACDFESTQFIFDNAAAPPICRATCTNHGGWNGQWTNRPPAAPAGKSVCGCSACPLP